MIVVPLLDNFPDQILQNPFGIGGVWEFRWHEFGEYWTVRVTDDSTTLIEEREVLVTSLYHPYLERRYFSTGIPYGDLYILPFDTEPAPTFVQTFDGLNTNYQLIYIEASELGIPSIEV